MKHDWKYTAVGLIMTAVAMAYPYINPITAGADLPDAPNLGDFRAVGCMPVKAMAGGYNIDIMGSYKADRRAAIEIGVTPDPWLKSTMFLTVDNTPQKSMTLPATAESVDVHIGLRQVSPRGPVLVNTKWVGVEGPATYTFISVNPTTDGRMSCQISDG